MTTEYTFTVYHHKASESPGPSNHYYSGGAKRTKREAFEQLQKWLDDARAAGWTVVGFGPTWTTITSPPGTERADRTLRVENADGVPVRSDL